MEEIQKLLLNATLVAAILGGLATLVKLWRASEQKRQTAMQALFAELEHVKRHYTISSQELQRSSEPDERRRRLLWAKYGPLGSATPASLKENVVLGTQQVAQVLQLAFVIRNTDTYIDELLVPGKQLSTQDIDEVAARMAGIPAYASVVADYVKTHNKGLAPIQWEGKS